MGIVDFRLIKQFIILLICLILFSETSACSCLGSTKFMNTAKNAEYVIKATAVGFGQFDESETLMGYKYAEFIVHKYFKGNKLNDTIKIAMSKGYECFSTYFEKNEIYYVTGEINSVSKWKNNMPSETIDKILVPSECATAYLWLNEKRAFGKISLKRNKLTDWFNILRGRLKKKFSGYEMIYVECMKLNSLERKLKRKSSFDKQG